MCNMSQYEHPIINEAKSRNSQKLPRSVITRSVITLLSTRRSMQTQSKKKREQEIDETLISGSPEKEDNDDETSESMKHGDGKYGSSILNGTTSMTRMHAGAS